MARLFDKVCDLEQNKDLLIARPYGMIEAVDGKFQFVHLRPFPKMISIAEAHWFGGWSHNRMRKNRIQLYYNQPIGHRDYLALKYVVSTLGTTLATIRAGLRVLDEIARLKRIDAIVCEVTNRRMNDRVMRFAGYERHLPNARRRHYIRRFYGQYPAPLNSSTAENDRLEIGFNETPVGQSK